ncbi:hypothetical protein [Paenibacillus roseipurpureus]|uniref:Uncharacterized protein n=1 Tax=Paenibacillus roseopurpureus TaxID=2918901 RepID=A0AA96LQB4_9BACL|nr:hypothetical protein [Paenibacillus sp. MBLB1832]WNR45194.1 hypothetical protein MJB10_03385 [Paenibacillus sp. MBLB1832]
MRGRGAGDSRNNRLTREEMGGLAGDSRNNRLSPGELREWLVRPRYLTILLMNWVFTVCKVGASP